VLDPGDPTWKDLVQKALDTAQLVLMYLVVRETRGKDVKRLKGDVDALWGKMRGLLVDNEATQEMRKP
jgi:hypothetical protein